MPKLSRTCAAYATALLVLGSMAGLASAAPSDGEVLRTGPDSGLEQMAHNGSGPTAAEQGREHPERFVRIAGFNWSKAVPALSMQADLTIESALPFALKEVEVACAQFARSGVEIDRSRRTIAEVVPAHGRLQVKALDLGPLHPEAGSSGCRVVSVTPA